MFNISEIGRSHDPSAQMAVMTELPSSDREAHTLLDLPLGI